MIPENKATDFNGFPDKAVAQNKTMNRYQGFSLSNVTWGYRNIFEQAIEELFQQGYLGPQRPKVTSKLFELLKRADQSCFDYVLREFLGSLNPQNRWIMDLPGVFSNLVDMGGSLAESRLSYGSLFFATLASGGMGKSPEEVLACLHWLRRLRTVNEELAIAFLSGYAWLSQRLRPSEMERYIEVALQIHAGNPESGCNFLRGESSASETYILAITQECRLCDVVAPMQAMIKALTGNDCEVLDLGRLDSDDLIEHGTRTLTVNSHVYVPARCRRFDAVSANRRWYMLCMIISAAMLMENSFPRIHGHPQYRTCAALTGDAVWRLNLFQIVEFVRVLRIACRRWPGVRRLVAYGVQNETADVIGAADPERLFADAMNEAVGHPVVVGIRWLADNCVNCFDTVRKLDEPWTEGVRAAYPALDLRLIRPMSFLSDFLFPVSFSDPFVDQTVADLKDAIHEHRPRAGKDGLSKALEHTGNSAETPNNKPAAETIKAAFLYDEWDFQQNEYHPAWCCVHQKRVEPAECFQSKADWIEDARKVRTIFERIKPDIARREKHLADGDTINQDLLVAHVVDRYVEPCPAVRFYEKPIINHRDLAVLILLDISGSTGKQLDAQVKVLDVEKQAGVILGQGLAVLGDRFAVCGFNSNGREQCEYLVFKDFADPWSDKAIGQVLAAWPQSSTRIGPALRHSGHLLSLQPARRRLILLVTDGKPMDQGYDPATRYAQHDVRMACEEITRQDIRTFAISTEENSLADMEIMFPRHLFAILPDIRRLPEILPRLYIRMTAR